MSCLEERWRSLTEGSGGPVHGLLRVASWGYGSAVALRNTLYDYKLFKTHSTPLPTISVGNLLIGGSGKTPLVHFLAQEIEGKVAILSRGYGSRAEKRSGPTLVSPDSSWEEVGDEPLMLARRLPDALVIVCADRVKGAHFAKELGAETLILDDGFQHRRLSRDQNIVCIPASTPLSRLALFPRSPLREPLSALKRATLIAITECTDAIPLQLAEEIKRHTPAPQAGFTVEAKIDEDIHGKRVALFCGIARPERFKKTVERLGGEVVEEIFLPDHGVPSEKELQKLKRSDPDLILCTEKDWVKGIPADGYVALGLKRLTSFNSKI